MEPRPTRVLIVDGEPQVCNLIREELSGHGLDCQITTQPQEARELLDSRQFGLLITGVLMPQISGLDMLVYAKEHASDCKVILITVHSERKYLAEAIMLGAYDYIEKPFSKGELAEVVLKATNDKSDTLQLPLRAAAAMETISQGKRASLDSVRALVRAVEAKDPFTRRHSEQVAHYATNLAKALNVPEAMIEQIWTASLLHDIGKIGVPDYILTKPGKLTDEEFGYIRRHPALGAEILENITLFRQEAQLIRHHHERWDGKGYPDGLTGEETPFASRIMCVADCMDAMLMERTYKEIYPVERMIGELVRCADTQFDMRIATTAVQWCLTNPDKLILPGSRIVPAPATLGRFG